jgi:hypothetical protein
MKFKAYREHTASQLHKPISQAAYVNIWLLRDANYATHNALRKGNSKICNGQTDSIRTCNEYYTLKDRIDWTVLVLLLVSRVHTSAKQLKDFLSTAQYTVTWSVEIKSSANSGKSYMSTGGRPFQSVKKKADVSAVACTIHITFSLYTISWDYSGTKFRVKKNWLFVHDMFDIVVICVLVYCTEPTDRLT